MTKFYYGRIDYVVMCWINESLKKMNSKLRMPCFHAFNIENWWNEDYCGFYSRGFVFRDSSITYNIVENWLEYQDGKSNTILRELSLTEGTYYND